jgi:hypothetical protein
MTAAKGTVYVFCIRPAYFHAAHYIGWTCDADPSRRIAEHLSGQGSRLVAAAVNAGRTSTWCSACLAIAASNGAFTIAMARASVRAAKHSARPGRVSFVRSSAREAADAARPRYPAVEAHPCSLSRRRRANTLGRVRNRRRCATSTAVSSQ